MDGLNEVIQVLQCDWSEVTSIVNSEHSARRGPLQHLLPLLASYYPYR
jgi:hypothetical protein